MNNVCPVHDATAEGRAARRARVVALTREGRSATDIAFILGISVRSVTRNRALAGLTANYVRPPVPSEDQLLAAKWLLVDGASYPEVARTLGFNATTWRKHFPGYAWSRSEAGAHGKTIQLLGRAAGLRR
jgi:hypothetical protein